MSLQNFFDRLASHSKVEPDDVEYVRALAREEWDCPRGSFITRSGEKPKTCAVLKSGVAVSHKITGDGGRQIVSIYFAGDIFDIYGLFRLTADHNIQALTDCRVTEFDCDELADAIFKRRSFGEAVLREAAIRCCTYREWMVTLGRRDSSAKVAHLLCELSVRLRVSGEDNEHGFELPITQEQIADVVGITPMHVGRVLKELEAEGLVARNRREIRILDWRRLQSYADFSSDYLLAGDG